MKQFARTTVILLTIITMGLGATLSAAARADYQAGVEAYSKGDFKKALEEWSPLAEGGDAVAQNSVGALYNHGLGVTRDDAAAVHWYELAANQNLPLAMRNLASMYANGHGVPFDKDQADYWYQKAAEAGDPVAIKRMAARLPSGAEFAAASTAEPTPDAGGSQPAAPKPAPAEEPMTVAGGDDPDGTSDAPMEAEPAQAANAVEETPSDTQVAEAPATAPAGNAAGGEALQYGEDSAPSLSTSASATAAAVAKPQATATPAATQQAAVTPPPPPTSDPTNWLIGMWQGPSLGCPPGGGMEFLAGETRSYYEGQIAARLPAKYEVTGDTVTVTSTGVDGIGHSYQYRRTDPNTFVIEAVPADMPQSMIGIEHHRCASAPLAAAAASPAPAPKPAAPAQAAAAPAPAEPTPAPAAKPFVPESTTSSAAAAPQPAPKAVPVKPVTEAPKLDTMAAVQPPKPAAATQQAASAPGSSQAGWDAFGRGDYAGALAMWQPLAEKGDIAMQLLVGSIYDYGQGVPQDDAEAVKWYEMAAKQGSAKGQYQAGAVYARSSQIKDPVEGYKWLTIAARTLASGPQNGVTADQATTLRTLIESEMSKDEIAKARQEADAFKAKKE